MNLKPLSRLLLLSTLALLPVGQSKAGLFDFFSTDKSAALPGVQQAKQELEKKPVCCDDLSQLEYQQLKPEDHDAIIDFNSQVFRFKTGKSLVLAYKLPLGRGSYKVTIESEATEEQVFYPNVLLLDADFKPLRWLEKENFKYVPAKLLKPDALVGKINISGRNEAYMLIFTTEQLLRGATALLHPAKAFAKATHTVPPDIKDPLSQHSPVGKLAIKVEGDFAPETTQAEQSFKDLINEKDKSPSDLPAAEPSPVSVPQKEAIPAKTIPVIEPATPVVITPVPPPAEENTNIGMQVETESFYNQIITKAINAGDIDKALKLLEEAERAGSRTARDTFIKTIKGTQH